MLTARREFDIHALAGLISVLGQVDFQNNCRSLELGGSFFY